jgi:hypothetical protein
LELLEAALQGPQFILVKFVGLAQRTGAREEDEHGDDEAEDDEGHHETLLSARDGASGW